MLQASTLSATTAMLAQTYVDGLDLPTVLIAPSSFGLEGLKSFLPLGKPPFSSILLGSDPVGQSASLAGLDQSVSAAASGSVDQP